MPASALAGVLPGEALADDRPWMPRPGLGEPEAIVSPGGTDEVVSVMEWASTEGIRVVVGRSGRRQPSVPVAGPFVVLSTHRLTGIELYESADLTFTARGGTLVGTVDAELGENRQWLPFDPPDVAERSLGGLVATGDSGALWMGYGQLRNHVLGATVVTGDGRVLKLGGRVVKNVAGFDLLKPLVGSRGSLGVVTSVCLRAFPLPAKELTLALEAPHCGALVAAALSVGTAPVLPVASVMRQRAGSDAELLVRLHGDQAAIEADRATLETHVGAELTIRPAATDASVVPGGSQRRPVACVLVGSVLPSKLAEALDAVQRVEPESVWVDSYQARLRIELTGFDIGSVTALRGAFEGLGGALMVERVPAGVDPTELGSAPTADERRLADRIREIFDPAGVLRRGVV